MSGFSGYDQWKTASPYDDEPDCLEEAERFVKDHKDTKDREIERAVWIIDCLLGEI